MNFVDVESLARGFLIPVVSPVSVHTKVPATRPATFVRVWRTGGAAANRVLDRPIITVQVWGPDSVSAATLAGVCREALLSEGPSLPLVRGVEEVSGLYFDPDPSTGVDRYTFSVQLSVRAQR